jgi:hypothetical protein
MNSRIPLSVGWAIAAAGTPASPGSNPSNNKIAAKKRKQPDFAGHGASVGFSLDGGKRAAHSEKARAPTAVVAGLRII